mmetsp:Transcript_117465/g.327181  ORF Transcript_117465/g.327181 Transcript_117465/m.327181 type:complete len:228 (-) Transcript_117465:864-1547(-)
MVLGGCCEGVRGLAGAQGFRRRAGFPAERARCWELLVHALPAGELQPHEPLGQRGPVRGHGAPVPRGRRGHLRGRGLQPLRPHERRGRGRQPLWLPVVPAVRPTGLPPPGLRPEHKLRRERLPRLAQRSVLRPPGHARPVHGLPARAGSGGHVPQPLGVAGRRGLPGGRREAHGRRRALQSPRPGEQQPLPVLGDQRGARGGGADANVLLRWRGHGVWLCLNIRAKV